MGKEVLHIYTRVSSDSQEDNTSLHQQKDRGERLAKTLGMKSRVWSEGAASSSKEDFENRPILTELMGLITRGEVKHLYAEYQDRLSRNTKTWGAIRFALRDNDVLFYSQSDPSPVDLTDPTDELIFGVLSEISQFDNRMREMRLSAGKFQRVSEGKWQGGPAPFGYKLEDKVLVVEPEEAKWVENIYQWFADRTTIRQIQDKLRDNGVLTRRGNAEWSLGSIEKVLTNTHYIGHYVVTRHKTGESWRNECPSIISKDLKDRVVKLRESRTPQNRVKNPNQKHFYLLTDFMWCGECGRKYRGRITPSANQYIYYCPAKEEKWRRSEEYDQNPCDGVRSVNIGPTDTVVWDTVVEVISKSHIFKESIKNAELESGSYDLSEREIKSTQRKLREIERKIDKYTESIGNLKADVIVGDGKKELLATINKLELDRENLQTERETIRNMISEKERGRRWIDWVGAFRDKIDTLQTLSDEQEKQRFLKEIVEGIYVYTVDKGSDNVSLEIRFTLPYVDDGMVYRNVDKKSEGYDLVDGENTISIVYTPKKKK